MESRQKRLLDEQENLIQTTEIGKFKIVSGHFGSILGNLELGFKIRLSVVEYSISIITF